MIFHECWPYTRRRNQTLEIYLFMEIHVQNVFSFMEMYGKDVFFMEFHGCRKLMVDVENTFFSINFKN